MTFDALLQQATERVMAEQDAIDAKLQAYETFISQLQDLNTTAGTSPSRLLTTVGTQYQEPPPAKRCREVRHLFAETIRPHSIADLDTEESLVATIKREFTDEIGTALAPTTATPFSPELKRTILAKARSRHAENTAFQHAISREATQLDTARDTVSTITDTLTNQQQSALTDVDFDTLRSRHETLAAHREQLETLADTRQAFLQDSTTRGTDFEVSHHTLIEYLYPDLSVGHPVLDTVLRLEDSCIDAQQTIRHHLAHHP